MTEDDIDKLSGCLWISKRQAGVEAEDDRQTISLSGRKDGSKKLDGETQEVGLCRGPRGKELESISGGEG